MSCKQVIGKLRRRMGTQFWEYTCPYCNLRQNHRIGPYTENPENHRVIKTVCCGAEIEMKEDRRGRGKRSQ